MLTEMAKLPKGKKKKKAERVAMKVERVATTSEGQRVS